MKLKIDKKNWIPVSFGDVVAERRKTTKDPMTDGLTHIVGLEHIDAESIHLRRFDPITADTTFTKTFQKGDVLFGRRRAYLKKAAQAPFSGICSGDITVMYAKEDLLPELLPFLVNNDKFFDYAVEHSAGGLSPRVKFRDLANYKFLLPPKPEQARLAELLWAGDGVLEGLEKVKQISTSLPKIYFNEASKELEGEKLLVGEIIDDIVAGNSPKAGPEVSRGEKFAVLKVSAVGDNQYYPLENKILHNENDWDSQYEVSNGFVLVTRANAKKTGVGRACIVKNTPPGLMLSDKTLHLVPNIKKTDETILLQNLQTPVYRNYVENVCGGTDAKNISQKKLRNAPCWVPGTDFREIVTEKLQFLDLIKDNLIEQLKSTRTLQKALINQIF